MSWFTTSVIWYLYVLVLGVIFFPITAKIFSKFADRGYPFAKTLAIIIASYTIYLLGIVKIVPFTQETIFFLLVLFILFSYYIRRDNHVFKELTRKKLLLIAFEELLFFISFISLVVIRGREPSIRGLEKFMDFGFIQAILRSRYFPPIDMWLSADPQHPNGYPINYYYFGHLTGAFLIKLTGISPFMGYNLILATIFAQGITLSFSLTSSIVYIYQTYVVKKIIHPLYIIFIGILGSLLVNLAGNLHTIYIFTKGYPNEEPIPFWGMFQNIKDVQTTMQNGNVGVFDALIQNSHYWYPNATRFIPFTIHEFPSYSYVVADLHGHVFDIPFVLVTMALLFVFFVNMTTPSLNKFKSIKPWLKKHMKWFHSMVSHFEITISAYELGFSIFIGFMLGVHYMTNAFDGPIYFLLAAAIFFYIYRISVFFLIQTALMGLSFIIFSLPFSAFFSPFVSGIGVNCSPGFLVEIEKLGPFLFEKGNCQISEWWMLAALWGFFWIGAIIWLAGLLLQKKENKKIVFTTLDWWLAICFGFGTFLIIIPEFFYIKDIYPQHFRANTMFKMGYQAYMLMSITSALVLYRLHLLKSPKKYILKLLYFPFLFLVFMYPFVAFPSYYPISDKQPPELDGTTWMNTDFSQDKEIIQYIQNNITGQPVILEAQGDSYTDYNVISAYTGVPTVAGWWVHEWLWRGSSNVVGDRIADIVTLYESGDIEASKAIIDKYNIEYVVVSKGEKEKYKNLNEKKFELIGRKIFESKNGFGALYKVN